MPKKIRFIIGFLAVVAVGFVLVGIRFVNSTILQNDRVAFLGNTDFEAPDIDADKDGLNDIEESYWNTDFQDSDTDDDGFLDGEEVASGHNPLKPGPDDMLPGVPVPQNLTNKMSSLVVAGLAEGSLKQGSTGRESSVNLVVDDLVQQADVNFGVSRTISVRIVPDDKAFQSAYHEAITPILDRLIRLLEPAAIVKLSSEIALNDAATNLKTLAQAAQEIAVPKSLIDQHLNLVYQLRVIARGYELIATGDRDPLQAMFALQMVSNVMTEQLPETMGTVFEGASIQ